MPDSMIIDDTGGMLNVTGSNIVMAAMGPIPGSTPTNVPQRTPTKQNMRLSTDRAVLKPRMRLGMICETNSIAYLPKLKIGYGRFRR